MIHGENFKRVDPKSSHHKEIFSFLLSLFLYLILIQDYKWMLTKLIGVIFS